MVDTSFYWTTIIPVLDFWWCLLWVLKPEWAALFTLGWGICDVCSVKFTSGATPADHLISRMVVSHRSPHTYFSRGRMPISKWKVSFSLITETNLYCDVLWDGNCSMLCSSVQFRQTTPICRKWICKTKFHMYWLATHNEIKFMLYSFFFVMLRAKHFQIKKKNLYNSRIENICHILPSCQEWYHNFK